MLVATMMQWIHALIIAKEEDTTIANTVDTARAVVAAAVIAETQSIDVLLLLSEAKARVHAEIGNDIAQLKDMHL